jgi:hypothetical protein
MNLHQQPGISITPIIAPAVIPGMYPFQMPPGEVIAITIITITMIVITISTVWLIRNLITIYQLCRDYEIDQNPRPPGSQPPSRGVYDDQH